MKLVTKMVTILVMFYCAAGFAQPRTFTMSFKAWKRAKIERAVNRFRSLQAQMILVKDNSDLSMRSYMQNQLKQSRWNIEMAKDLTIKDYLALYLARQKNPNRFKLAALKLSPKETAHLLEVYLNDIQQKNEILRTSPTPSLRASLYPSDQVLQRRAARGLDQ